MMMTTIMIHCFDNGVCNYYVNAMMDDDWRWLNVCCHYHHWRLDIPWWITIHDVNDSSDDKSDSAAAFATFAAAAAAAAAVAAAAADDDDGGGGGGGECYIEWSCRVVSDGIDDSLCFIWC